MVGRLLIRLRRFSYVWMSKNGKSKQVLEHEVQTFISDGWVKGRGVSPASSLVWVHKYMTEKRVRKEDIDSYLSRGYSIGRARSCSIKGKVMVNKDGKSIYVPKELVDIYVDNGWIKGSGQVGSTLGKVVVVNKSTLETSVVDKSVAKELVRSGLYYYTSSSRVHMYRPDTLERVMVFPDEVDKYKSVGYVKGRPKNYTSLVFWMHNDTLKQNKRVKFEDVPVYEQRGWVRGQGRYNRK